MGSKQQHGGRTQVFLGLLRWISFGIYRVLRLTSLLRAARIYDVSKVGRKSAESSVRTDWIITFTFPFSSVSRLRLRVVDGSISFVRNARDQAIDTIHGAPGSSVFNRSIRFLRLFFHRESPDNFNFFESLIISTKLPFDGEVIAKNHMKNFERYLLFQKSDRAPEVPV